LSVTAFPSASQRPAESRSSGLLEEPKARALAIGFVRHRSPALHGSVPRGGACHNSLDCSPNGYCAFNKSSCPGRCVSFLQAGASCIGGGSCAPSLICGPGGTCTTPETAGARCVTGKKLADSCTLDCCTADCTWIAVRPKLRSWAHLRRLFRTSRARTRPRPLRQGRPGRSVCGPHLLSRAWRQFDGLLAGPLLRQRRRLFNAWFTG
jgi:hypothetical protein